MLDSKNFFIKFVLVLILNSFFLLWMDALDNCDCFLGFSLKNVGYFLKKYPFFITFPWLPLFVFFPARWKLWLGGTILTWCMNDLLWFLVKPEEWIKFWQFKNEIIYEYKLMDGLNISVTDVTMFLAIVIRLVVGIVLVWLDLKVYPANRCTESS